MLSSLRPYVRAVRDWIESRFFRLWCFFCRIPINNPRRRLLCRQGLRHLREGYWTLFVLEKYRVLWRYVLLIEWFAARDEARASIPVQDPSRQRILFIRLSHFGDLLHLVPLLRGVRQAFPEADLDLLVGPWGKDVANRIPYVDRVYTYAPHLVHLNRGNASECLSWRQEIRFGRELAGRGYDSVMATYGVGLAELFLIQAAQASQWIGPNSIYGCELSIARQIISPFEKDRYEATRMARLGRHLSCNITDERLEFWIRADEESRAQRMLDDCNAMETGWAVVCPGAGWPGKQWPLDRYAALSDRLIEEMGLNVLICGAASEELLGEQLVREMKHSPLNCMGRTTLGVLAALVRDARLFVGGDSGPMHLTGVYGTPCVALFGPTPPEQWAPRGSQVRVIRNVSSCPDCWPWHPERDCVHGRECMRSISIEQVWSACQELL